ncbi:MAG: NAD(P)/FAD-dependent oxidoreductase [Nitrospirae bacterium]|nr:NAD(P)/FAD-dependent oxidoreductase [Nitrospirota bacterium]
MDARDAVIVGGGPAGSTAAWRLKKAGFQVVLMDRAVFPRDKVCAGWITPAVVELLALDREAYRQQRVFQAITGFQVSSMSGSPVEIQYPYAVSYGIRRYEFDEYLLHRSNAELCLGESVHDIRREGSDWIINGRIKTPLLIGAGGHHCPVARYLGKERDDHKEVVIAQEAEFFIDPEKDGDYAIHSESPELYFSDDLKGYGWCFKKGAYLNVGLGREDRSNFSRHMENFLLQLKQTKKIPQDKEYVFKGHSYILNSHSHRDLSGDGVLLIGDSAGLAYAESGEGIRPAIESALFAAETIIESNGDYNQASLASYDSKILHRFGERGQAAEQFPGWITAITSRYLMSKRWFVDKILLDRLFLRRNQSLLSFEESIGFKS